MGNMVGKQHYFLVVGEIVFSPPKSEEIHAIRMNAIITGGNASIPVRALGKAQQALQVQFYERMQEPTIQVRDVVILGMTYMGYMTKEEFETPPEGTQQVERTPQEDGTNTVFNETDNVTTH